MAICASENMIFWTPKHHKRKRKGRLPWGFQSRLVCATRRACRSIRWLSAFVLVDLHFFFVCSSSEVMALLSLLRACLAGLVILLNSYRTRLFSAFLVVSENGHFLGLSKRAVLAH